MRTVSCIIPAYNEAPRIAPILEVIVGHPDVSEVIVVDDGSRDGTGEVVARYPVKLVSLKENGGKSAAIVEGVRRATGELVLLLDADLLGLSRDDITRLIEPVASGRADISISLRKNTPAPWRWIGLDYISGERVVAKKFLEPMLGGLSALHGFGLEVYMNRAVVFHRLRIAVVWWGDVESPFKFRKDGWLLGIKGDLKMMWHIFRVISPFEALVQIVRMRRQRI